MSRAAVTDFVRQNYAGDRMVVAAAGKLEHDAIVAQVAAAFADLPAVSQAKTAPARYRGGEHRTDKELEQVHLVLGFDGVSFDDPDFYALQVFSTLFGGGMSSRLFQEVREKRGLAYSIYSFTSSFNDGGIFGIYAGTGPDQIGELIPVLTDQMGAAGAAVDDAELARAKAQLKSGLLMSQESTANRAEQMAQHMLVRGRIVEVADLVRKIEAIDSAAIGRAVARLRAAPPTVAATGPLAGLESYEQICARLV